MLDQGSQPYLGEGSAGGNHGQRRACLGSRMEERDVHPHPREGSRLHDAQKQALRMHELLCKGIPEMSTLRSTVTRMR